jgi:hypothetical protein
MSAQEIVDGHAFSRTFFISSMRLKPLSVPFAPDSFSDSLPFCESIKMDASHP